MKFTNECSMTGFTTIKVVGMKQNRNAVGIHRLGPIDDWTIQDAICVAHRDGFGTIYLHTTSPKNVVKRVKKHLSEFDFE